ncbi:MAG: stage III sporulation protein AC [Firmicutes bacterium]|nr:stage III sporulation protein AC [Bacillota bacterium]
MTPNIQLVWQIAGIGILTAVVVSVLTQADRKEFAWLVSLGGVTVVLWLVVRMIADLFQTVRAIFQL